MNIILNTFTYYFFCLWCCKSRYNKINNHVYKYGRVYKFKSLNKII